MMICKADFEELFPDLFKPEPAPSARPIDGLPIPESIAHRADDDGGRSKPPNRPCNTVSGCRAHSSNAMQQPVRVGAMAATMPVALVFAVAWNMLSAYAR